ncbi:abi-like family protein, partial [Neisseria meningitidis]
MERYKNAVGEDKAAELYLLNLSLSRELFHVVSIFEIVLRNKIDICLQQAFKDRNWLYNSIQPQTNPALKYQGCFLRNGTKESAELIKVALSKIQNNSGGKFDHNQLVAGLGFGFWRYLFA